MGKDGEEQKPNILQQASLQPSVHTNPAHPTEHWPSQDRGHNEPLAEAFGREKRQRTLVWKIRARTGHFIPRPFTEGWRVAGTNKGLGAGRQGLLYVLQHNPHPALPQQPQQNTHVGMWVSRLSLWSTGCGKERQ